MGVKDRKAVDEGREDRLLVGYFGIIPMSKKEEEEEEKRERRRFWEDMD